ncbi:MAG: hypothetical protein NZL96_01350 [Patescibacteria group bacterium]|nr:hypothetical protein [Patescibacteria group bacterium]
MTLWQKILFCLILAFWVYFRISPIINLTVPYTYDQGRDFLKVKEMVEEKNLPFIGPTTGREGIFHGVWIYYFLSIPYLLTGGEPISFYLFFFFLNLLSNIFFFLFLQKNFNLLAGFLFLAITSVSDYFVRIAFFPSNDHLSPIFVIFFIISSYFYFKNKKKQATISNWHFFWIYP